MSASRKQYRILVVDDEPSVLEEYRAALTGNGTETKTAKELARLETELFGDKHAATHDNAFDVVLCTQGDEAVEIAQAAFIQGNPFAVAFIDVRMPPGPDGVKAAKQIRFFDPNINMVIVTGFSDYHPREITKLVPPADKILFLKKPLHADEVRQLAFALGAKWTAEKARLEAYANMKQLVSKNTRELQQANRDLQKLQGIRKNLVAAFSNELRIPLAAAQRQLEATLADSSSPASIHAEALTNIGKSIAQLDRLLDDLLFLADAGSSSQHLSIHRFPLEEMLKELTEEVHALAGEKACHIEVSTADTDVIVEGDRQRLKQLFLLLVDNALHHCDNDSDVRFAVAVKSQHISASIHYRGSRSNAERREQRPDQMNITQDRESFSPEGVELGLAVAKSIIEAHYGELTLFNSTDGGTTVSAQLPLTGMSERRPEGTIH